MFTSCRSECIRRCDSKKGKCHARCHIHKMSNIRVSKIFGFESQIIRQLCSKPNQLSNYQLPFNPIMLATTWLPCPKTEHQWSIYNCWPCILDNARAVWRHYPIFELSAALVGKNGADIIAAMSQQWASTQRRRLLALHHREGKGSAVTFSHNQMIGHHSRKTSLEWYQCHILTMSITEA
jgi:hypothetical protein